MTEWTDERVDTLKRLIAEGHSYSQIAHALGGISRSAAIGKAHRLNLLGQRSPSSLTVTKPRRGKARSKGHGGGVGANIARMTGKAFAEARALPIEPPQPPECAPVSLMDLALFHAEGSHCRWPIGEACGPDTLYCGAPKAGLEIPYCKYHQALSGNPSGGRTYSPERRAAMMRGRGASRLYTSMTS